MTVVKHWHKLPKEAVDVSCPETFLARLDATGSEQPVEDSDPIEDVPAHCRGIGLYGL